MEIVLPGTIHIIHIPCHSREQEITIFFTLPYVDPKLVDQLHESDSHSHMLIQSL
jgi:hypothetical protein